MTSNGQAGSQAGNGSRRRRRAAPSLEELSPQTVAMVERLRRTWCEAFGLDVANYPPSLWVPVVPDAIAGGLTERDLELATRGAPLNGYVRRTGRREPSWILGTVERVIEFRDAFVEAENRRRSHALPEAPLAPPPEPLSPEQEGRIEQIKRDLGQRIGWKPKQAAAMPPRGPVADELRRVGGS